MSTETLRPEKYVQLTTYRKNGKAVPTPVWFAVEDGRIYVWSERNAGKVKRIRAGSKVDLVACDLRGKTTHGPTITGTARLTDDAGTERVRKMLNRKYGIVGWLSIYGSILRGGRQRTVGIEITPDE